MKRRSPAPIVHVGPAVRVDDTDVGRGLYVTRDFAAGGEILALHGPVIDFQTTLTKGERECDALQFDAGLYLDLEAPAVFLNHSCDPNTGIRSDLWLIALRPLTAGEEIRFDYSTTMDEDHWTLECRCGAAACRGMVGDFKMLPRERKLEYIRRDIVPPFLVQLELERGRLTEAEIAAARHPAGGA